MHMTWVNNPYFTRVLGNEVSKSGYEDEKDFKKRLA